MRNSGTEPVDLFHINVFLKERNAGPVLIPKGCDIRTVNFTGCHPVGPTEVLNMSIVYSADNRTTR